MNLRRKITNNAIVLFLNRIILMGLAFFVTIWFVRYLGKSDYGKYSLILAYLSFFEIITGLGIDSIVVREISKFKEKQNALIGNAILIKLVFSLVAVISSYVALVFLGYTPEIRNYIHIYSVYLLFSFGSVYVSLFRAHYRISLYAVPEVVINSLNLVAMVFLIKQNSSLASFVILQTVVKVATLASYACFAYKIETFRLNLNFDKQICLDLLRSSLPLFLSAVFITINSKIGQMFLFSFSSAKDLGVYSAMLKLVENFHIIPVVTTTVLFPLLSSSHIADPDKFRKIFSTAFKYMGLIIVPIAIGTTLLSQRIIELVYGHNFVEGSVALAILMWSEVFVFLGTVNSDVITAAGLQKYLLYFTVASASMSITLNRWLIPQLGINGASIATLVAYSGGPLILVQFLLPKTRQITIAYLKSFVSPLLCSIPMGIFLALFPVLNTVVLIVIGAAIYFVTILVGKGLNDEDFRIFRRLVGLQTGISIAAETP